jgi:hypothetical protein
VYGDGLNLAGVTPNALFNACKLSWCPVCMVIIVCNMEVSVKSRPAFFNTMLLSASKHASGNGLSKI